MSQGKIVQIIGAVVDVEFAARGRAEGLRRAEGRRTPRSRSKCSSSSATASCARIALGSTDGLKRNLIADNTGHAISVPVGMGTLGRIMDVLGRPIDEAGPVEAERALGNPSRGADATRTSPRPTSCWKPASRSST